MRINEVFKRKYSKLYSNLYTYINNVYIQYIILCITHYLKCIANVLYMLFYFLLSCITNHNAFGLH